MPRGPGTNPGVEHGVVPVATRDMALSARCLGAAHSQDLHTQNELAQRVQRVCPILALLLVSHSLTPSFL